MYGALITLISVESSVYNTAVEVAAGNQLMHVVVEDDETASRLMEELLTRRAGRVTFKPLNVLQARGQTDDEDGEEAPVDQPMDVDPDVGFFAVREHVVGLTPCHWNILKEAIPLLSKLNFEAKFAPAVRAAFGRTLLCRNTHVASSCAKRFKVCLVFLHINTDLTRLRHKLKLNH